MHLHKVVYSGNGVHTGNILTVVNKATRGDREKKSVENGKRIAQSICIYIDVRTLAKKKKETLPHYFFIVLNLCNGSNTLAIRS